MNKLQIPANGIRLSHSTMSIIHTCERKFQLEKLLLTGKEREESADTVFGSAYGVGVQNYFIHQDKEQALFKAWMAYYPELETEKKSITKMLNCLEMSFPVIDSLLEDYEVVYFEDKPAEELGFCLLTDTRYYFVGYLDLLLKNRWSGKYIAVDVKTTGLELENLDPVYKNSPQLIGYSIVVDAIAGEQADYDVMYFVCQTGRGYSPKIKPYIYHKTLLDRLNWFISLAMDIEHLMRMEQLSSYPLRGNSCLTFNRPCKFFNVCQLHSLDIPKEIEPDTTPYPFMYHLQDLIDSHVQRS